jgi:hypothetical protein
MMLRLVLDKFVVVLERAKERDHWVFCDDTCKWNFERPTNRMLDGLPTRTVYLFDPDEETRAQSSQMCSPSWHPRLRKSITRRC